MGGPGLHGLAPASGTSVLFSPKEGERGWRAFFPAVTAEDLRAWPRNTAGISRYLKENQTPEGVVDSFILQLGARRLEVS